MVWHTSVARPLRAIGLVMTAGIVISACGDSGDESKSEAVTRQSVGEFSADMSVTGVFASDDVAWVSAVSGGDTEGLWQLSADGGSSEVGGLLEGEWVLGPTLDGGLAVGRFRCGDRAGSSCGEGVPTTAEVDLLDRQGESVASAELWTEDGPVGDGTTIAYVGSGGGNVWVRSNQQLLAVSPSGEIVQRLPSSQGLECVVDGDLYSVSVDGDAGGEASEPGGPEIIGSPDAETASRSVTATVHLPEDGVWEAIDGQSYEIDDGQPEAHCQRAGIAIDRGDSADPTALANWSPGTGWSATARPRDASIPTEGRADSAQGSFFLANDGAVLARTIDGSLEGTGLELQRVGGPEEPTGFSADGSAQISVACASTISPNVRNTCDVMEQ
jgi:hypothetical protein